MNESIQTKFLEPQRARLFDLFCRLDHIIDFAQQDKLLRGDVTVLFEVRKKIIENLDRVYCDVAMLRGFPSPVPGQDVESFKE